MHLSEAISMDRFEQNGEYDVIRSYTGINGYPLFDSSVENLVFGIELRRKYSYYLVNVVLPVFFMQLLGLVVFLVPTESGEKLTFALTLLLSLTVMMTLVAEKIPTTSLQIPTLSIYMLGGTVISSLELIMTVVILQFKHYDKEGNHVTRRMQSFATFLALLTCTKRNKIDSKLETSPKSANNCSLNIVEEITKEDTFEKDVLETKHSNKSDPTFPYAFTYEEIALMMDKCSLFLFTIVTLLFTLSMLVMIS
ncbi:CHRNA7-FAM7A fusion protein-like isoform X2 [Mercenaria mercenaria]|nr:CHRNA7-FAM7A fusion protein-like isoform X2 [Mercenaria mercenaria]